ncbi:uncharacterized protein BX664DRAFT_369431 [Halteromyces radiatus]|uniref:uncharacterized protein n=1 Tax=Halteromyces radiatus TaxID=101107 RepID=UPI00221F7B33|nr:uncharacterized protein BX664DRAFT_369431 [Halteromyces radiatus]KAI8077761.1 hypothetical protein BX664DRAFT_369431 [Halteromyces radiatus]
MIKQWALLVFFYMACLKIATIQACVDSSQITVGSEHNIYWLEGKIKRYLYPNNGKIGTYGKPSEAKPFQFLSGKCQGQSGQPYYCKKSGVFASGDLVILVYGKECFYPGAGAFDQCFGNGLQSNMQLTLLDNNYKDNGCKGFKLRFKGGDTFGSEGGYLAGNDEHLIFYLDT